MIVWPSVSIDSSGGYDASTPMVRVPLLLIAAGTSAAAALDAGALDVVVL